MLSDTRTQARYREKLSLWLQWLGVWRFSTVEIYRRLFRYKPSPRHLAWLRSACREGLLTESDALIRGRHVAVFCLGPRAQLAAPDKALPAAPSDTAISRFLGRPAAAHDLAIQWFAATSDDPIAARPASGPAQRDGTPDLYLPAENGLAWAYELEVTRKSRARVFRCLSAHMEAVQNGELAGVRYLFVDEAVRRAYVELFAETYWPRFHYFAPQRKYAPIGDPFVVPQDSPLRRLFHFDTVDDLWPISVS